MSWRRVLPNVSASGACDAPTYADQGTGETNLQYAMEKELSQTTLTSLFFDCIYWKKYWGVRQ